ncbi:TcpE family conjugal transfer membrane protein [Alicyclobacillus sp. SO9]|uniref:TcpE family conjugal transfer membrane protein n=1 Tax=Alicyclobacillus sp. SO9 TaxID=2665646 RepID=UPI0018E6EFE4|nr:TcpE family conjugal transfer membrane protein [Alicyclobacillus sp. SO9]QQE79534.1 hypothetical protein GI364_03295 [Alicyclobacillus sp. SO9]
MNRTYRKLFHQRPTLTSLGDFKFPAGISVPLDGLLAFVICLLPAAIVAPVLHWTLGINRLIATPMLAFAGAWLATRMDMQGKPFPVWLMNLAAYFFRAHHSNGWDPIKAAGRIPGSLQVDVGWLLSKGNQVQSGALPVEVRSIQGDPVELQTHVPVDVRRLERRRYIIQRAVSSATPRHTKKATTGLQPGQLSLTGTEVKWQTLTSVPTFQPGQKASKDVRDHQIRF